MASLESRPVRTKSDSSVQRHVEEIVRASLQTNLGLSTPVVKRKFKLGSSWVEVDCFAEADGVVFLAEINAHHGLMKTSTRNKVLKDILKMSVLEKAMQEQWHPRRVRKIILFTNDQAATCLTGRSWAAEAARMLGIEPLVIVLSPQAISSLEAAQRDQDLRE